jgi:hypothetical protein
VRVQGQVKSGDRDNIPKEETCAIRPGISNSLC